MQVEFLDEGERLIARPRGRMEASDGASFVSLLQERLRPGISFVTLDLDELAFINFGGIRAILRLARLLGNRETGLDFVRGNAAVREALDQAGLDDFFPFTPPYQSSSRG